MNEFTIALAGRRIRIVSRFEAIKKFCKDYLTDDGPVDFSVVMRQEIILAERDKAERQAIAEGMERSGCSTEYLETLAIYRMIAEEMLKYDTFLFHGSVVAVDGEGYLFTALSGTGKSTHTAYWRQVFGERAVMINDDKPLIRIMEDGVLVCGTPWDGKHRLSTNAVVPLKGLCILNRAEENNIEPISARQAMPTLLQQCYRPEDPQQMAKVLQLLDKLTKRTGLYNLGCNMSPEAAHVAYNGMNRKEHDT